MSLEFYLEYSEQNREQELYVGSTQTKLLYMVQFNHSDVVKYQYLLGL